MTPHDFIAKWNGADGSERANYPLFFNDLCDLLGVERPQPAQADDWHNAYVNERYIDARDGESAGQNPARPASRAGGGGARAKTRGRNLQRGVNAGCCGNLH